MVKKLDTLPYPGLKEYIYLEGLALLKGDPEAYLSFAEEMFQDICQGGILERTTRCSIGGLLVDGRTNAPHIPWQKKIEMVEKCYKPVFFSDKTFPLEKARTFIAYSDLMSNIRRIGWKELRAQDVDFEQERTLYIQKIEDVFEHEQETHSLMKEALENALASLEVDLQANHSTEPDDPFMYQHNELKKTIEKRFTYLNNLIKSNEETYTSQITPVRQLQKAEQESLPQSN